MFWRTNEVVWKGFRILFKHCCGCGSILKSDRKALSYKLWRFGSLSYLFPSFLVSFLFVTSLSVSANLCTTVAHTRQNTLKATYFHYRLISLNTDYQKCVHLSPFNHLGMHTHFLAFKKVYCHHIISLTSSSVDSNLSFLWLLWMHAVYL